MRTVIVHTFEQVMETLDAASQLGVPVMLQSAPDAIFYAGSLYLLHMFNHATAEYPKVDATFVLDCSDASGEAIAAMQLGHKNIRSNAPAETRQKLAEIAEQNGVAMISEPFEFIDLLTVHDAKASLLQFLSAKP